MQQFFQFIILTFVYSSNCFGRFPALHQELNDRSRSLWFYLLIVVIVVLYSWSGRPPQDWNIRVRICSIVPVVSSLMREPIRVSVLLVKFAIGRLQSITWSVTYPSWMKTESLHEPITGFSLEPTKSSCLHYIFSVTSEFVLSHMGGCCPKQIF
jgi:hypothetical protein